MSARATVRASQPVGVEGEWYRAFGAALRQPKFRSGVGRIRNQATAPAATAPPSAASNCAIHEALPTGVGVRGRNSMAWTTGFGAAGAAAATFTGGEGLGAASFAAAGCGFGAPAAAVGAAGMAAGTVWPPFKMPFGLVATTCSVVTPAGAGAGEIAAMPLSAGLAPGSPTLPGDAAAGVGQMFCEPFCDTV